MTPLDAALRYAAAGWYVFPCYEIAAGTCTCEAGSECVSPGKHPIVDRGFHKATTEPATIRSWWGAWPHANVAVAMRPSGLVAIDIDPRNGGDASFRALESDYGYLPRGLEQATGGGGVHILMADPGGDLRGKVGQGVDIRSRGYVMVEPSNHASGGLYEWRALTLPAPAVPPSWLAVLAKPEADPDAPPTSIEAWRASSDVQALDPEDAHDLRSALQTLERGHGRGATFQAVRMIFHGYGLSLEDGWAYLCEWNQDCGKPYLPRDLERQLHRIAGRPLAPEDGQRGHLRRHGVDLATRLNRARAIAPVSVPEVTTPGGEPPAPPAYALPTPPEAGSYAWHVAQARAELERVIGAGAAGGDGDAPFFGAATDLLGQQWPATPWLVQGLITEGGIVALATEPKSAKTWLATEIALAVASGTPACGEFPTVKGRVAYLYAEDMGRAIATRLRSLCVGAGRDPVRACADLFVQPAGRSLDVMSLDDCARVVASCRLIGQVRMVWLDPLRDVHAGDEDSSNDMAQVGKHLRAIATVLGATVGFVHHSAKSSADSRGRRLGQRMRGSSVLHGIVDSGIYLADLETDDVGTFTNRVESQIKAAKGAGHFTLTLRIDDDAAGQAVKAAWSVSREVKTKADAGADKAAKADEAVLARVRLGPPMSRSQLRAACGISVAPASEAIIRLLGTGAIVERDITEIGADMRAVKRRVVVIGTDPGIASTAGASAG